MNQIIGGDAAVLMVVAPVSIAVGVLAMCRHPAAPVPALAPSVFVVYTYIQLIVGNEYLRVSVRRGPSVPDTLAPAHLEKSTV